MAGMKVPVYEEGQGGIATARVSAPRVSGAGAPRIPVDAFGGEVGGAIEKLGEAGKALSGHLLQIAFEEQDKEVLKRETAFRQDLQNRLSDPATETIEVGDQSIERPRGLLNRPLGQAKGITQEFDSTYYNQTRPQYLKGLTTYQHAKLAPAIDAYFSSTRNSVISHEGQQLDEDFKNSVKANLEQKISDATLISTPGGLSAAIDDAVQSSARYNSRYDKATQKLLDEDTASKIAKASTISVIDNTGDYRMAKSMLDAVKDKIPAAAYSEINTEISKRAIDISIAADMSTSQEDSLVMAELQKGKKGIFYFLPESERIKAVKESQQRIYYNAQTQKREIDKVAESRSDAIIKGFMDNTITLSYIENEMLVPEEAGGVKRSELLSYQKALKSGINGNLKEMLMEKTPGDKNQATDRAQKVREYLSLINTMGDETDKWHAKEALAKAYADGVIDKKELAFLNSLKKKKGGLMPNLIISSLKGLQSFFTGHNALTEDTALGLKQLTELLSGGKTDPIVASKTIQQNYIYRKIPEATAFTDKGQLMMDGYGNKAIVYPDGHIEPYIEKPKAEGQQEKK